MLRRGLTELGRFRQALAVTAVAVMGVAVTGCAPQPTLGLGLRPVAFEDLPGWTADRHSDALPALWRSCARLTGRPDGQSLGADEIAGTVVDWREICAAAAEIPADDPDSARRFIEQRFIPHLVIDGGQSEGLFTGYYEAELRGSRTRNGPYRVPIYRRPDDLVTVDLGLFRPEWRGQTLVGRQREGRIVPYATRSEIEAGVLAGKGLELLWVDDPVDAFFLHIQGSGRIVLDDGGEMRVGFAGRNGHPYVAIGRELIERGAIPREQMSMQAIRAWLARHPDQAPALLASNPSFIFFRVIDGEGPVGAQGVTLTAGRSLAVDPAFVPLGVPIWMDTFDPRDPQRPLRRLVVAQDTGAAIKGAVRGDLFWGSGEVAAVAAGMMRARGRYFLLLPRRATAG